MVPPTHQEVVKRLESPRSLTGGPAYMLAGIPRQQLDLVVCCRYRKVADAVQVNPPGETAGGLTVSAAAPDNHPQHRVAAATGPLAAELLDTAWSTVALTAL